MTDALLLGMHEENLAGYTGVMNSALLALSQDPGSITWEQYRGVFLWKSEGTASTSLGLRMIDYTVLVVTGNPAEILQDVVLYMERYPQDGSIGFGYAVLVEEDNGTMVTGDIVTVEELVTMAMPDGMDFDQRVTQMRMFVEITGKLMELGLVRQL